MKEIKLTKGFSAQVDDEDYDRINQYKWYVKKDRNTYYAVRDSRKKGKRRYFSMHREILNNPTGTLTDHKDRNGLNNQRSNIRVCTRLENNKNVHLRKDSTTGIKGVCFDKRSKRWCANIGFNGRLRWLGYFNTPKDAEKVYDEANIRLFGDFSSPNRALRAEVRIG